MLNNAPEPPRNRADKRRGDYDDQEDAITSSNEALKNTLKSNRNPSTRRPACAKLPSMTDRQGKTPAEAGDEPGKTRRVFMKDAISVFPRTPSRTGATPRCFTDAMAIYIEVTRAKAASRSRPGNRRADGGERA